MISIYSKILKAPFGENYRNLLCESLVLRHKNTIFNMPKEQYDSLSKISGFDYLEAQNKMFISTGFNFNLNMDYYDLSSFVSSELLETSKKIFGDFNPIDYDLETTYAYLNNKDDFIGCIHVHPKATIVGVYYLRVPSENSGEIIFYDENDIAVYSHFPKQDELILFPNYLKHQPQKSNTEIYRIAINKEITLDAKWVKPSEYNIKLINI
jgi:hypothetical protein